MVEASNSFSAWLTDSISLLLTLLMYHAPQPAFGDLKYRKFGCLEITNAAGWKEIKHLCFAFRNTVGRMGAKSLAMPVDFIGNAEGISRNKVCFPIVKHF